MKRKVWMTAGILFLAVYLGVIAWHQLKPMPEGTSYAGEIRMMAEEEIEFLRDLTYNTNTTGEEQLDHEIFEEIFSAVEEAEHFLIVDMFMVNEFSDEEKDFPELSRRLSEKIAVQMEKHPELKVAFITDEINTTYSSHPARHLDPLVEKGAEVVYVDLERLRDPNPIYTGFWRIAFQWFGQEGTGWLPNGFGPTAPDVTLRSYLKMANIKANHRKAVITENEGIITSANPHDASGFHSNTAVRVRGEILYDMVESEKAVAAFSGGDLSYFPEEEELDEWIEVEDIEERPLQAQIVTERKIEAAALEVLERAEEEDTVWIGMFYLSDRDIMEALVKAAARGAEVRLILDPNQNAFGQEKMGLPNIPAAAELLFRGNDNISIRWYDTQEEQYHTKIMYVDRGDTANVIAGSTNFTTRNLNDYNLENNISITAPPETAFIQDVDNYFHKLWDNEGAVYTADYEEYTGELSPMMYGLYVLQKAFRFTTY
jgi:phosphatidylserine/phosphatidylglycerophosphate/cardiolipin synthase-like enzyme